MNRRVPETDLDRVLASVRTWGDRGTITKISSTLRDPVSERTLRRWLTQLVREGRLIRRGASSGTTYAVTDSPRGNGADPRVNMAAGSGVGYELARNGSLLSGTPNGGGAVAPERFSVTYDRAILDAYHPNEMAYLTGAQRMDLSRWSRDALVPAGQGGGRDGGVPASGVSAAQPPTASVSVALSPQWQRFTAELVRWSRDAHVDLGFAARRHRRVMAASVMASVVARPDVPTMAGELRRIWNHCDAVAALLTLTQTSGLTWSTVAAVQSALTRAPTPAASASAPTASVPVAPLSSACRPLCRTEPLNLSGTTYRPTTDPRFIEPCLRQILLTAAAIQDPAEASFFTFAHLLLLLPFAAENLSSAVLLANAPLIRAHLEPVSLVSVSPVDLRVAVLSWWELGNPALLARAWSRPAPATAR